MNVHEHSSIFHHLINFISPGMAFGPLGIRLPHLGGRPLDPEIKTTQNRI